MSEPQAAGLTGLAGDAFSGSMASEDGGGVGYRDAGVDIDAADRLIERISGIAATTRVPGVLSGVGGFGALFSLRDALGDDGLTDPVLVSGTDGVGTKLKLAVATKRHESIGIDLVAMCVNDILCSGAKPLFFLDYFATGKLDTGVAESVVLGIAEGCRQAGCALVGGETAELPGMYAGGDYDLAGFAVGIVDRHRIIDGRSVAPGQAVLGVLSAGIHANGLSLARRVLLENAGLALHEPFCAEEPTSLAEELLKPTPVYTGVAEALFKQGRPHAIAHITGGGLSGNLARVLPAGCTVELARASWPVPAIFRRIAELGPVSPSEMERTFNMGLGLVAIVDDGPAAVARLRSEGFSAAVVGHVRAARDGEPPVVYA